MNFLEDAILYPDAEHLLLLKILIAILTFIYFTFAGVFTGCASLSVIFNILNRRESNQLHLRFSEDVIRFITASKSTIFLLGILPLFTMAFTYAQIYQGTPFEIAQYFLVITFFTFWGFFFTYIYKHLLEKQQNLVVQIGVGLLAIGLFVLAFFILSNTMSLQMKPEKWAHVQAVVPIFIYENVIPRFLLLTTYVFALTGAAILFFFSWPDKKKIPDEEYARFIKKFSAVLSLIFILLQPIFVIWSMMTFPEIARSRAVFTFWGISLVLMFSIAILLYSILTRKDNKYFAVTFILFLASFLTITIADQIASGNASYETSRVLIARAEEIHQNIITEREERIAASMKIDGALVFANVCSACHKFDQKVVGPPLNTVKEKYLNDVEALNAFILNPVKVRPDYPPMPKQAMNKFEIAAVADYLLEQWKSGSN